MKNKKSKKQIKKRDKYRAEKIMMKLGLIQ